MNRHKKQYARTGTGAQLWCGDKIVMSCPSRFANFSLENCECGMDVQTVGHSPETDKVMEYEKK